jgi:iron complex transport system substrate-binding protein
MPPTIIRRRTPAALALALLAGLLAAPACGVANSNSAAPPGSAGAAVTTHAVTHDRGTTAVPDHPARVVVLDTPQLDAARSLGVLPVGSVRPATGAAFPAYLGDTAGMAEVGTVETPNLEAIAALRPDVILSSTVRHGPLYDQLSRIAPTVFAATTGGSWQENSLLFADALGRKPEAQQKLAAYHARLAALRGRLPSPPPTVGVVRFLPDEIRVYGPESFSGSILRELDVSLPAAVQDLRGDIAVYPSREQVDQARADVLYVTTWGDKARAVADEVQAGPLWGTIPAVRSGRVHPAADDVWMLGIGLLGAGAVLDDLERTLPA